MATPATPAAEQEEPNYAADAKRLAKTAHGLAGEKRFEEAFNLYMSAAEVASLVRPRRAGVELETKALLSAGSVYWAVGRIEDAVSLWADAGKKYINEAAVATDTRGRFIFLRAARTHFEAILRHSPRGVNADFAKYGLGLSYEHIGTPDALATAIDHYTYICGGRLGRPLLEEMAHSRRTGRPIEMPGPHPVEQELRGFVMPQWPWSKLRVAAHARIAWCLIKRSPNSDDHSSDRERALKQIKIAREIIAREAGTFGVPDQFELANIDLNLVEARIKVVEAEHLYKRALYYKKLRRHRAVLMTLEIIEKRFDPERLGERFAETLPDWQVPEQIKELRRETEEHLGIAEEGRAEGEKRAKEGESGE